MKKLLFLLCMMPAISLYAQTAQPEMDKLDIRKFYRQEIGLFSQLGGGWNTPDNYYMAGLQYKRFKNEHLGYRIIAGVADYNSLNDAYTVRTTVDTFMEKTIRTHITLPMAGVGLEAQRHFYKNIYLFAAMELKAGYGTGFTDTQVNKTFRYMNNYAESELIYGTSDKVSMFYTAFTPTIGAKAQRKRLGASVELLPLTMSWKKLAYANHTREGLVNLSIGDFYTRITVSYNFN